MDIIKLKEELDRAIGYNWKIIEVDCFNLIIEVPHKDFVDDVTKFMEENSCFIKFNIKVVEPPILPNKPRIYCPTPHRPDPKLKVISYSTKRLKVEHGDYERLDEYYYLESFVFNDGSVWDRARGKWKLVYQPEVEND